MLEIILLAVVLLVLSILALGLKYYGRKKAPVCYKSEKNSDKHNFENKVCGLCGAREEEDCKNDP
jgi:hypothetical protein